MKGESQGTMLEGRIESRYLKWWKGLKNVEMGGQE